MKKETSTQKSSWSAHSDQQFTDSSLGQRVLELIETGSRSQRQLSEFILRDPVFVATHGIEELSKASGISPSTISRYVRDLGLENFGDFRSGIAETVHALIAPVTKLGDRLAQNEPNNSPAEASLASSILNLEALVGPAPAEQVRDVAALLKQASNVWTMGFGLSAHLAAMLALGLQPYRDNVVNVVQFGGTEVAAGRLMSAEKGDVLVAVSFPRYSSEIITLAQAARAIGVKVVALTDSKASPLARIADHVLLAPSQHPVLSSSSVPGLAVIEALVSEFLLSDPAHLERAGKLAAAMAAYLSPGD